MLEEYLVNGVADAEPHGAAFAGENGETQFSGSRWRRGEPRGEEDTCPEENRFDGQSDKHEHLQFPFLDRLRLGQ